MAVLIILLLVSFFANGQDVADQFVRQGYRPLFNGRNLDGWVVPARKNCWHVIGGVIDCEIPTPAPPPDKTEKDLWTEASYGDYKLHVEWRIKRHTGLFPMPVILPDGSLKKDANGNVVRIRRPNSDSGILIRGSSQVNIWCWPVGSGELENVRTNPLLSATERAAAVPRVRADKTVGEWNAFDITLVGDRITVVLNGEIVIDDARLTAKRSDSLPDQGSIGFQYHVGRSEEYGASSLVQFRNIFLKPLDGGQIR